MEVKPLTKENQERFKEVTEFVLKLWKEAFPKVASNDLLREEKLFKEESKEAFRQIYDIAESAVET